MTPHRSFTEADIEAGSQHLSGFYCVIRKLKSIAACIFQSVHRLTSPALQNSDGQIAVLDAALEAAPKDKAPAGADSGLTLLRADHHALHFVFGVMEALFALVTANCTGIPGLAHHARISRNGRNAGISFALFRTIASALDALALIPPEG